MADDAAPAAFLVMDRGIARLTLDRPRRMNALDEGMHRDLRAALQRIEADKSVGALIPAGSGNAFCAGRDLTERAAATRSFDAERNAQGVLGCHADTAARPPIS